MPASRFDSANGERALKAHYNLVSLDGLGAFSRAELSAAGSLIAYLELTQKGAKVALLTTEGHRDVIEMREGLKPDRYDLHTPPPEPLVPRELRFGVRERLKVDGSIAVAAVVPRHHRDVRGYLTWMAGRSRSGC